VSLRWSVRRGPRWAHERLSSSRSGHGEVVLASVERALDLGYALARRALFRLDAEEAHRLVLALLRLSGAAGGHGAALGLRRLIGADDPRLAVEAFGLRFPSPIGLAAGMDKNAVALPAWAALGFGHVEVGTVTPCPQPGNPRPRVFRLPAEGALINRMGFPNEGAARVARRLADRDRALPLVIGGNVGKGRDTPLERAADDYAAAAAAIGPQVDYLAVNVSSPNTPGLRQLQAPAQAAEIVARVRAVAGRPVLLKLGPDLDLDALPEIVAAARAAGAAGLIATNTTSSRDGLRTGDAVAREAGGLSGAPLRARALRLTERLADLGGGDLPVVSVGAVASPADVRDRLAAGARLVQLYTALVYEGPALVPRLLHALLR
jgi:dihydroorotate dehydrogenase